LQLVTTAFSFIKMSWFEALILGLLQGLTEFLPVSSSGHLEIAKKVLDIDFKNDLAFTVIVHAATVLSIIIVFRHDLKLLALNSFKSKWNDENRFVVSIAISMLPVLAVGFLMKEDIEGFFGGNILLVGFMLILTSALLFFTRYAKISGEKNVNYFQAIIIGMAQAIAIMPGISRSGTTIAIALLLGVEKTKATRFSFLMVLIPILGAGMFKTRELIITNSTEYSDVWPLIIGAVAAFISGLLACTWMINIVKKGKLNYFAFYCLLIGFVLIVYKMFF